MAEHTPGPFLVEDIFEDGQPCIILGRDVPGAGNPIPVAQVFTSEHPPIGVNEAEANARLFAAAPDLLAALKQLMRFCCRPGDDGKHDDGYDLGKQMAREAIAKVEGA